MAMLEPMAPFAGIDGESGSLRPVPFRRLLALRGDLAAGNFRARVEEIAGVAPPMEPNVWARAGETVCFWLGPDEWLLSAPDAGAVRLEADLAEALADDPWAAVVDVSHAHAGLHLFGPHARDVLARGCPLDLADDRFGPNACARTLLGQTGMLLRRVDALPTFELWVRPSYAAYVRAWLSRVERAVLAAASSG